MVFKAAFARANREQIFFKNVVPAARIYEGFPRLEGRRNNPPYAREMVEILEKKTQKIVFAIWRNIGMIMLFGLAENLFARLQTKSDLTPLLFSSTAGCMVRLYRKDEGGHHIYIWPAASTIFWPARMLFLYRETALMAI